MSALAGLSVLDLTSLGPGPYCTMLLADLGADVLMVERPPGPRSEDERRRRSADGAMSRNKRSLGLNLKDPRGREVFDALLRDADVVVESFRPGVMERLGLGYSVLAEKNARVVLCSISGWGRSGPLARTAGHDLNYLATSGFLSMVGRPGQRPAIPMNLVGDYGGGGLMAAFGILAALHARERTGRGQHVDVAMSDGVSSQLTKLVGQHVAEGIVPIAGCHRINGGHPYYDVYECADGGYLAVGPLEPKFFGALMEAVGAPELSEHREDEARWPEIREVLTARFRERPRDEWVAALEGVDACVSPVLSLDEALEHPQNARMVGELDGRITPGVVPVLSDTPGSLREAPPAFGAHTDEALARLGFDDDARRDLRESGVVA